MGRPALTAALERATTFRRFKAQDVRSILSAGTAPTVVPAGLPLEVCAPDVSIRSLDAYALETLS